MPDRSTMNQDSPPICDYEGSDYQDRFWKQGGREYEDRVEAVALKRLLPETGTCLLQVGAGAGRNTPRFQGYERIVLLDYSRTQLQQAVKKLGMSDRFCYVAGDVYRLPFARGVFDGATMIRTLHHMAEPQRALRQVRSVLARDGVFVLEYANKRNVKAILRWIFRRQAWNPFDTEPVEFAALNYDFHPHAIRNWLTSAGFHLERQLTVSHFRQRVLKKAVPTSILVGMDALLQWSGDLWQYSPSVFTRSHAVGESDGPGTAFWKCPTCSSTAMEERPEGILCTTCGLLWPIEAGIYNFKVHLDA